MKLNVQWLEEVQKNIGAIVERTPLADVERNVRSVLTQGFSKLDLVTRDEFDIQARLLERSFETIAQLESQLKQLEARIEQLENKQA